MGTRGRDGDGGLLAGLVPAGVVARELVADLRPEHPVAPRTALELPARSAAGGTLAGRLRQRGVVFVGPTTAHQVLLRTGVLPGHLAGCFRAGTGSAGSG